MSARHEAGHEAEGLKYGAEQCAKGWETLDIPDSGLGQRNPQHCPYPPDASTKRESAPSSSLGAPLTIAEVAAFLGCSPWTVRQRYLRQGLPCLRASASGKLVFFERQVIDWILKRQHLKKGGTLT